MPHWLDQYANNHHEWRETIYNGQVHFQRPFGIVETAFDTDGVHFVGRADISASLELEIKTNLVDERIRQRITLAWTALRLHHVLLMAKAVDGRIATTGSGTNGRSFVLSLPANPGDAISDGAKQIIFTEDKYSHLDESRFYRHAQNTGRVFDASEALAKVFILPTETTSQDRRRLRFLFVMSHQITDGLTNYTWLSHFVKLLNMNESDLSNSISAACSSDSVRKRLPLPQEDLYPQISGSRARKRWFWLLTLVLRHVRKPMPAAFPNPLQREKLLESARHMPSDFDKFLDYTKVPPQNTFTSFARLPRSATGRLHRLCREAGASIGAGCFVLVAMVMMSLYESRHPSIPLSERRPFIGSFPINPRPFFDHFEAPDSLMLAFSDGIVIPFLPSDLDVEKRFKLLVRQAHRQLGLYQKRKRPQDVDMKAYMGSRGAGRVIAMNYIGATERLRAKLPKHLQDTLGTHSPQGDLPVQPNPTMATCGVSSVGRSGWRMGEYDVDAALPEGKDAFVADYRSTKQNVRAREGEFLVGIGGDDEGINANVSYDGCAIDEELVEEWKIRMESMLAEVGERAKL